MHSYLLHGCYCLLYCEALEDAKKEIDVIEKSLLFIAIFRRSSYNRVTPSNAFRAEFPIHFYLKKGTVEKILLSYIVYNHIFVALMDSS
jgi:hypothetical protein